MVGLQIGGFFSGSGTTAGQLDFGRENCGRFALRKVRVELVLQKVRVKVEALRKVRVGLVLRKVRVEFSTVEGCG